MKKEILLYFFGFIAILFTSCAEYLDERPDQSLALPDNLKELEALLDYEDRLTSYFPAAGDIAADYYFLHESDWLARNLDARNTYLWDAEAQNPNDWAYAYIKIMISNVVLDNIHQANAGNLTENDRREIEGRAYFYRGWTYYHLSQLYCPHFEVGDQDSEYGLPLKRYSDINELIERSSVKTTYAQIVSDLEKSARLLPEKSSIETRPSRAAAYAALARLYLVTGDYGKSLAYADSCLQIKDTLLDYNELNLTANLPFGLLNDEVIFHAIMLTSSGIHTQSRAYADSLLVQKYDDDDLRSALYFRSQPNGQFWFKGFYSGSSANFFAGIATDEIYLIKAESLVRLDELSKAHEILNALLIKRFTSGKYYSDWDGSKDMLLRRIITEREKELLFRGGIRWSDLRRLNRDPRFAKTLRRKIGDVEYVLNPHDLRYTFLLPFDVVKQSDLKQNPR